MFIFRTIAEGFKKSFDYRGVSKINEILVWLGFIFLSNIVFTSTSAVILSQSLNSQQNASSVDLVNAVFCLVLAVPTASFIVRRLRDSGARTWLLAVFVFPASVGWWADLTGYEGYELVFVFNATLVFLGTALTCLVLLFRPSRDVAAAKVHGKAIGDSVEHETRFLNLFKEAVTKTFDYRGVAKRGELLDWLGFTAFLVFVMELLFNVFLPNLGVPVYVIYVWFYLLAINPLTVLVTLPAWSFMVRRMRDAGLNPLLLLWNLIPLSIYVIAGSGVLQLIGPAPDLASSTDFASSTGYVLGFGLSIANWPISLIMVWLNLRWLSRPSKTEDRISA